MLHIAFIPFKCHVYRQLLKCYGVIRYRIVVIRLSKSVFSGKYLSQWSRRKHFARVRETVNENRNDCRCLGNGRFSIVLQQQRVHKRVAIAYVQTVTGVEPASAEYSSFYGLHNRLVRGQPFLLGVVTLCIVHSRAFVVVPTCARAMTTVGRRQSDCFLNVFYYFIVFSTSIK